MQPVNAALTERLLALKRPRGVEQPVLTYGADHSGDRAVWIVFPVGTELKLTKSRVKTLFAFAEAVRLLLGELQITEIPYIRFRETGQDVSGE